MLQKHIVIKKKLRSSYPAIGFSIVNLTETPCS